MTEKISTTSKIYANSLLDIGLNSDVVIDNFSVIRDVYEISEFKTMISNPVIDNTKKCEVIDEIFKNKIDDKMISFIKILIQKERFGEINEIISAYKDIVDDKNNIVRADVISAVELSDDYKSLIAEKLQTKYQKTIIPDWIVDDSIIGGLVIKIKDDIFDNSIKSKIEKIGKI